MSEVGDFAARSLNDWGKDHALGAPLYLIPPQPIGELKRNLHLNFVANLNEIQRREKAILEAI